ncbi:MAG: hypothetical protein J6S81_09580 [Treponema sp.]|nr:hypothetical protein [Treponema sp.]
MGNKKFKILAIVDAVLIVVLIVAMFVLKGQYKEQAQISHNTQRDAYLEKVNGVLVDQWRSMDQYGMSWKLVYATLTGDKSEKSFDAAVKAIEEDKEARLKQLSYLYTAAGMSDAGQSKISEMAGLAEKFLLKDEGGVKEVACGKNCTLSFTFVKGKLKDKDYKALVEYNMNDAFKLEAPEAFRFE